MHFLIFDRNEAESSFINGGSCRVPHIWISITDSMEEKIVRLPENKFRVDSICLFFDDTEEEEEWFRGSNYYGCDGVMLKGITDKQAKEIVDFVEKWKDKVELICVNCEAGISRSSGTALALSMLLNGNDSGIADDFRYVPNKRVVKKILEVKPM